jgi:hypothetical protein
MQTNLDEELETLRNLSFASTWKHVVVNPRIVRSIGPTHDYMVLRFRSFIYFVQQATPTILQYW